jgi:hypothetical protein
MNDGLKLFKLSIRFSSLSSPMGVLGGKNSKERHLPSFCIISLIFIVVP